MNPPLQSVRKAIRSTQNKEISLVWCPRNNLHKCHSDFSPPQGGSCRLGLKTLATWTNAGWHKKPLALRARRHRAAGKAASRIYIRNFWDTTLIRITHKIRRERAKAQAGRGLGADLRVKLAWHPAKSRIQPWRCMAERFHSTKSNPGVLGGRSWLLQNTAIFQTFRFAMFPGIPE